MDEVIDDTRHRDDQRRGDGREYNRARIERQLAITALAGPKSPTGGSANLLNTTGDQKLNGTGTSTRTATLNASLSARVVKVLPGGFLYIEGSKDLQVNSEQQAITLRGIIRTADITTTNTVTSTQIADMEIRLNGKGVVGDAIRRPNFLYRLVMGLLPFLAMGAFLTALLFLNLTLELPSETRLKDLISIEGVRDNQLVGYGIVAGLNKTGDKQQTLFSTQSLANMLQKMACPWTGR